MELTFEQLPKAVEQLLYKLDNIERLLLSEGSTNFAPASEQQLTVKEASEFLSLAVPTVYGLVQRREIPFSKPGGKRLYFSKAELIRWINTGYKKTRSEIESEAATELAAVGRRAR